VVLVWRLFDRDEINLEVTPSRPGERCDGDLIDERPYGQEGEVLAISRVRYDASTGRACAKFTKAENSALYNVTSYEVCALTAAQEYPSARVPDPARQE
jgi:hypothetical protein